MHLLCRPAIDCLLTPFLVFPPDFVRWIFISIRMKRTEKKLKPPAARDPVNLVDFFLGIADFVR